MKPHKHAELIKAWADGAEIQYRYQNFSDWYDVENPNWDVSKEYRIKPADPVVRWLWVYKSNIFGGLWSLWGTHYMSEQDAKERAESGLEYKKLEWSREEFEE